MGNGVLHEKSSVQRLKAKISTEVELVVVSEYLPYNLWQMNFLYSQGYGIINNIVYQHNQSTIWMDNNGRN